MTLHGPDGSHWQAGMILTEADWKAIGFGIWRSSIRSTIDETFLPMCRKFRSRGIPFAGYHAMYPRARVSPVAQATAFHNACGGDKSIPAMLDWEFWSDGTASFADVVETADAIRGFGHVCGLLYTGHAFWRSQGSPTLSGHGMSLVNARYGLNSPGTITDVYKGQGGDQGNGWQTYGGLSTVIWQYGSKVMWGDRQMDMNAYRGRPADLAQWFWTPAPPPAPKPAVHPPRLPKDTDKVQTLLVQTSTDGQYYVTDLASYATKVTVEDAERGRDMRGWTVGPDGGPAPLDAQDSELVERLNADR